MADPNTTTADLLLTFTVNARRDGGIDCVVSSYGNSFADVYRGMIAIKTDLDRQIRERANCPHNPEREQRP